jgi:hypothetical protein
MVRDLGTFKSERRVPWGPALSLSRLRRRGGTRRMDMAHRSDYFGARAKLYMITFAVF